MSDSTNSSANPFFGLDFGKMMNEFDPSKLMGQFDPAKFADDFTKLASEYKVPEVDVNALLNSQQKNIAALTLANKQLIEGARATAERQGQILTEMLQEITGGYDRVIKSGDPKETAVKQLELIKKSYEKSLKDLREIASMVNKVNEQASQTINKRVSEGFDEIKKGAGKH